MGCYYSFIVIKWLWYTQNWTIQSFVQDLPSSSLRLSRENIESTHTFRIWMFSTWGNNNFNIDYYFHKSTPWLFFYFSDLLPLYRYTSSRPPPPSTHLLKSGATWSGYRINSSPSPPLLLLRRHGSSIIINSRWILEKTREEFRTLFV